MYLWNKNTIIIWIYHYSPHIFYLFLYQSFRLFSARQLWRSAFPFVFIVEKFTRTWRKQLNYHLKINEKGGCKYFTSLLMRYYLQQIVKSHFCSPRLKRKPFGAWDTATCVELRWVIDKNKLLRVFFFLFFCAVIEIMAKSRTIFYYRQLDSVTFHGINARAWSEHFMVLFFLMQYILSF